MSTNEKVLKRPWPWKVHPESMKWFKNAKFGIFPCWCASSVRGIDLSWPMQSFFEPYIAVEEYESLVNDFKAEKYDAREWAAIAKEAGARYCVLTAKHHDGYCMFDTSTTNYSASKIGPGRDLVRPFVEAFREADIKVGIYFSLVDWHDPDYSSIPVPPIFSSPVNPFKHSPEGWNRFLVRTYEQIRELLTNYGKIDLFWFDGTVLDACRWHSDELIHMMLQIQPKLIFNDRLPGQGDYVTPEQVIPFKPMKNVWETCITMNETWGYDPDPTKYKSSRQLLRLLAETAGKGGNFLLAVGPKPDGAFPEESVTRLRTIGGWMSHSSESIYGTVAGPDPSCFYGPMTRKGSILYLHVLDPPKEKIEVRGIEGKVKRVLLLKTREELDSKRNVGRLFIHLPEDKCDQYNTVVALQFEKEPDWP